MKIAQVITRMDRGGSPDIVRILCKGLSQFGEVKLITGPSQYPSLKTKRFMESFKDNVIEIPELGRDIRPLHDLIALIRLFLIFKKYKFDAVHTNTAKAGFLGRIAAKLAGVKVIVHTPHGHNFYGYFSSVFTKFIIMLERLAAPFADRIIAFTELEKEDMLKFKVGRPQQIKVINTGLELEYYKKSASDEREIMRERDFNIGLDTPLIGMVGRLEKVKGPEYFIEAARIIAKKYPNVKFVAAGDGSLRKGLESKTQDLGLEDKVIFTGWVENVAGLLSTLDLLVLPSLNEAVGNILLEAGAVEVPAVASDVGGVSQIIQDGITGKLVKPADPQAIASAVLELIYDYKRRIEMGKAAERLVKTKFNAQRMVKDIYDLYGEIYNRK